jgi:hypothetical protein
LKNPFSTVLFFYIPHHSRLFFLFAEETHVGSVLLPGETTVALYNECINPDAPIGPNPQLLRIETTTSHSRCINFQNAPPLDNTDDDDNDDSPNPTTIPTSFPDNPLSIQVISAPTDICLAFVNRVRQFCPLLSHLATTRPLYHQKQHHVGDHDHSGHGHSGSQNGGPPNGSQMPPRNPDCNSQCEAALFAAQNLFGIGNCWTATANELLIPPLDMEQFPTIEDQANKDDDDDDANDSGDDSDYSQPILIIDPPRGDPAFVFAYFEWVNNVLQNYHQMCDLQPDTGDHNGHDGDDGHDDDNSEDNGDDDSGEEQKTGSRLGAAFFASSCVLASMSVTFSVILCCRRKRQLSTANRPVSTVNAIPVVISAPAYSTTTVILPSLTIGTDSESEATSPRPVSS